VNLARGRHGSDIPDFLAIGTQFRKPMVREQSEAMTVLTALCRRTPWRRGKYGVRGQSEATTPLWLSQRRTFGTLRNLCNPSAKAPPLLCLRTDNYQGACGAYSSYTWHGVNVRGGQASGKHEVRGQSEATTATTPLWLLSNERLISLRVPSAKAALCRCTPMGASVHAC
jgi:hypothetical protein